MIGRKEIWPALDLTGEDALRAVRSMSGSAATAGRRRVTKALSSMVVAAAVVVVCSVSAAQADGPVVAWGGCCGGGGDMMPPASVNGTAGIASALAAGATYGYACAIQAGSGAVVCWGSGGYVPTPPPPASVNGTTGTASKIAVGYNYACAIKAGSGAVVCWGNNFQGQATPPASVNGIGGTATAIAAGSAHTCAIRGSVSPVNPTGSGPVVCWGDNGQGRATPPASVNGTAGEAQGIALGSGQSCAIQAGTEQVVCWGYNSAGQATPPAPLNGTPFTAHQISASGYLSCAVGGWAQGTYHPVCWGGNYYGELQPPYSLGEVSNIAAGDTHACAVDAWGAVVCWGSDYHGESTPPGSVNGGGGTASAVSASFGYSLALRDGNYWWLGGAGSGIHGRKRTSSRGDPVNTATGWFTSQVTDASLPGPGLPFAFTRSYSSGTAVASGSLGLGWTHAYAARLTMQESGDALLYGEDGQRIPFAAQPDGSFAAPPGGLSELAAVGGGYELTRRDRVRYLFDWSGRLIEMRDRNNLAVVLAYDESGNLALLTDSVGRVVTFESDASGRLTRMTLPTGLHVDYAYDATGNLATVTDIGAGPYTYAYDPAHHLVSITDPAGHVVVTNNYDAQGRVTQQTDALGHVSTFAYNSATGTTTFIDPRGNEWKDVYAGGVLVSEIDPLGATTSLTHDADFNVLSTTDPLGHTTAMTYDARGNLLTRTAPAPLSYTESSTWTAANDPLTITNRRGFTTSFEYDARGNATRLIRTDGSDVEMARDAATGLVTSLTDAAGKVSTLAYDVQGNLLSRTSPIGHVASYAYDSVGRMTAAVDPRGHELGANPNDYTTTYTRNAYGEVVSVSDPLGHTAVTTYDLVGNRTQTTDSLGRITQHAYDAANRLISVTAPGGGVTAYVYDGVGNLLSRTDALGHATTFVYDAANRMTQKTQPGGASWTYNYDAAGSLIERVDAKGNATTGDPNDGKTTYAYDALNRLLSLEYSDPATPDVAFTYDANGNRTAMTDGLGQVTFEYDNADRLTRVARGSDQFLYDHDVLGRVTQRTDPSTGTVTYGWTDEGRLSQVALGGKTTQYAYDAAGNLLTSTFPNGWRDERAYDRAARLIDVKTWNGPTLSVQHTYTRDDAGNPISVQSLGETVTYAYDALDRLTEACFSGSCPGATGNFVRYAYDTVGNRLNENRPGSTTAYSYNTADQLLSYTGPGGTTTFDYDANGNETRSGADLYAYDAENRQLQAVVGALTESYAYAGDGVRERESWGPSAAEQRVSHWDRNASLPVVALQRDGAGAMIRRFAHGNGITQMRVAHGVTNGCTQTRRDWFYHTDALGSVVAMTSGEGTLGWSYRYEPYGSLRQETPGTGFVPPNPMRFTGETFDVDTGLYHLRARQYDTKAGRFLAKDPRDRPTDMAWANEYSYVDGRPTRAIDPSGMDLVDRIRGSIWWGFRAVICAYSQIPPTQLGPGIIVSSVAGLACPSYHDPDEYWTQCMPYAGARTACDQYPGNYNEPQLAPNGANPNGTLDYCPGCEDHSHTPSAEDIWRREYKKYLESLPPPYNPHTGNGTVY